MASTVFLWNNGGIVNHLIYRNSTTRKIEDKAKVKKHRF